MSHRPRKDHSATVATLLVVVIVLVILVSIALVSLTYHHRVLDGRWAISSEWLHNADVETRSTALGQLGDYFGGTLNPILSTATPGCGRTLITGRAGRHQPFSRVSLRA